jgi:hypothetical protein
VGMRVKRLRLTGASATAPAYEVSFQPKGATDGYRPLSIVAGQSLTGKTTIIDFIAYCLGGSYLPRHDEVQGRVRGALLEVDLADQAAVIERAAAGGPSEFATVWRSGLDGVGTASELRLLIEPTGDPESLSQFVLASSSLDGVRLSDSVVKDDTGSAMLSIRDVFRVMIVTNDRLDSKNLVYEHDHFMVKQKYRQTIDVMFGVHDNEEAVLADRQRQVSQQRNTAQARLDALTVSAERDYPDGPGVLQQFADQQAIRIAALNGELRALDAEQRSTEAASANIRRALDDAQRRASSTRIRVRDRESLLDRLDALRGQYVDDRRKLAFLLDAEALFDPLRVTVCPVCFNQLHDTPSIKDGECSLCHHPIVRSAAEGTVDEQAESSNHVAPYRAAVAQGVDTRAKEAGSGDETNAHTVGSSPLVRSELRAAKSRLSSLNEYMARLTTDQAALVREAIDAERSASQAAAAVDAISDRPAPWLALRDRLTGEITDAKLALQAAQTGVRAWEWVEKARARVEELQREVSQLSLSRRKVRPDRDHLIREISARFAAILEDIGYPKLSDAYIGPDLIPHVRGLPYTEASSGGMVIVALAWNLALWEIAFEQDADAPGLLIIDSPQKNLGHKAGPVDEFADASLVERFYAHAKNWLATDGQGAQLIVVDNTPPDSVADDVVVRFTRRADEPPYGLIWDAVR